MNTCVYMESYIRRPLQSVERVRLHLLSIQPFPSPPRSKAQKRTSVQPAQVARQPKSRNPALLAPRQLESTDLLAPEHGKSHKSVLLPAQDCQIGPLGILSNPVDHTWHQRLHRSDPSHPRLPKCSALRKEEDISAASQGILTA